MSEKAVGKICSFKEYLEYSAFISVAGLLRIMPLSVSVIIGKYIAKLFCAVSGRPAKFIKYQMKECFGSEYSENEYAELVEKFYKHFGCLLAETVRLKTLSKDNVDQIADFNGIVEVLDSLIAQYGKGVFLATGHIGNWEFTGAAAAVKGFLAGSIARPQNNLLIDRMIKENRQYSGQEIWDKDGAVLRLFQAIRRKKNVGVLIDQDAGEQGLKVPFLGRSSSTNTAVTEMAIRLGAPILPCAMLRVDGTPMKFRVMFGTPVIPESKDSSQQEVYKITEKVNAELSKIIAINPEQWLWIHKRWKTPNPSDTRRYSRYE